MISFLLSLSGKGTSPLFFITPKVGFKVNDNFHLGGGLLYVSAPGDNDSRNSAGIMYGVGTFGSRENNFTFGTGWGFINGKFANEPFITLSGMTRVSKSIGLVTENWFIPTDGYKPIFSYGVRFLGDKTAFDLAFINTKEFASITIIGIPYIDYVVRF